MTLRQRFETIFNQHGCWNPDGGKTYETSDAQGLLTALVAAVPTVSRVAIRQLIEHHGRKWIDGTITFEHGVNEALVSDLHALLSPPVRPTWCEHMKQDFVIRDSVQTEEWTCPLCGKPRPSP